MRGLLRTLLYIYMKLTKPSSRLLILALSSFALITLFNVLWCLQTTFRSLSMLETWVNTILGALLLVLPFVLSRRVWVQLVFFLIAAGLMVSNLMYARTYFSFIPLKSYMLAGNLVDFKASVAAQMRWYDIVLPLAAIGACLWAWRAPVSKIIGTRLYLVSTAVMLLLSLGLNAVRGGFMSHYKATFNECYKSTCVTPMYTLAGNAIYSIFNNRAASKPEELAFARKWLADQRTLAPMSRPDSAAAKPKSMIVILLESFESWLLQTSVEGQELTPNLNRELADSTSLYFPKVVTQVSSGRSIDAQLLMLAGLMPMPDEQFSFYYPDNDYPTLIKAMKADSLERAYLMSPDKPVTWNQGLIAKAFGIDTLLMEDVWDVSERIGSGRGKLSDREFAKQIIEKMKDGEVFPVGERAFVQIVTYSGHNPFRLPDELKELRFSDKIDKGLADYMTMAHFTDSAIGSLLDYLKSRADYKDMLIVITGDHEGLADWRQRLLRDPLANNIISDKQLTPLIVLNSPKSGIIDQYIGQIDVYPTLLNLLGLQDYEWHGLGIDALSEAGASRPFAIVSMTGALYGDTTGVEPIEMEHVKTMGRTSAALIRNNVYK